MHQHVAAGHQRQAGEGGHARQRIEPQGIVRAVQQLDGDRAAISAEPGLQPHGVGKDGLERLAGRGQQDREAAGQASQEGRVRHPAFNIGRVGPVLALGRAPAGHADPLRQVAVAAPALRQQHQPRRGMAGQHRTITASRGRQVDLRADHQVQAALQGFFMGAHHARQRAFVGDRQRQVAAALRLDHQLFGPRGARQKAEAAAAVQLGVARQHGGVPEGRLGMTA